MSDKKDKVTDKMQEAMSRKIPKDDTLAGDDEMIDAMTENRMGSEANPVDGDPQVKAMSNEFELDKDKSDSSNKMTEAMKERRKVVKKND